MLREIKFALRSNFSSWGGSGTPISHSTPLPFSHLSYPPRKSSSRSYNRSPCRLHPTLQRHHLSLLHPSDIFQCRKHPTSALFAPGCKDYGTTELANSQTWRYTQNSHPQIHRPCSPTASTTQSRPSSIQICSMQWCCAQQMPSRMHLLIIRFSLSLRRGEEEGVLGGG